MVGGGEGRLSSGAGGSGGYYQADESEERSAAGETCTDNARRRGGMKEKSKEKARGRGSEQERDLPDSSRALWIEEKLAHGYHFLTGSPSSTKQCTHSYSGGGGKFCSRALILLTLDFISSLFKSRRTQDLNELDCSLFCHQCGL
ncbi:hypothetical protein LSTR_LSTR011946 [Laodelphax striatellus]|uniref:Uncharacterized protein n=1 Tax=Laodelphax striatellus TaxID=195883 RepID=A0A482WYX4_LAOST|nr:hypothetical protein LSTR_LSTR011946 [Laodelphax striatellus]